MQISSFMWGDATALHASRAEVTTSKSWLPQLYFTALLVVVDQFTPTLKFIQNHQLHNKLHMYMIKLIIIYDVVNIFSMKKYESLRKLRVGVNRYTGVNWSTTTTSYHHQ